MCSFGSLVVLVPKLLLEAIDGLWVQTTQLQTVKTRNKNEWKYYQHRHIK